MPNLRQAKSTSGTDEAGNDFTLYETDIAPYIADPGRAQAEADVTKARYGGAAIQDPTPAPPPGVEDRRDPSMVQPIPNAEPGAPYAKPADGAPQMPDFSRRNEFEGHVFKQLQSETMPSGNPFEFNPIASMNALSKQDLPELFARTFQGQVTWADRHLLDDDEKKHWQTEVKRYRAQLQDSLNAEKKIAIDQYNFMMNQFDNQAKEAEAARKLVAEKQKAASQGKKDTSAVMGQRAEAFGELTKIYKEISEASQGIKLSDTQMKAFSDQIKAVKDKIAALNAQAGIKPQASKPKSDAGAVTEEKVGGKIVARGKITGQAQAPAKKAAKPHGDWKTARTEVKRGKVKSGPNKGKTIVQYDDGRKVYVD